MNTQSPPTIESQAYFFNARELARLAVYRAAVVARFYTDQCEPSLGTHCAETVRLLASVGEEQQAA
jgi:hypothetical protein